MPLEVTPRAIDVLKRALEAGRMDPERIGVRLSVDRAGALRTNFTDEPETGDAIVLAGGIRLFIPNEFGGLASKLDVSDEHDQLVLRPLGP